MSTTPDFFGKPARKAPRRMMRMVDAGSSGCKGQGWGIQYECKCGHSEWIYYDKEPSPSQVQKGEPCPPCNQTLTAKKGSL